MFEDKTRCVVATYEVHDTDDGRTYEFVSCRQRILTSDNWRRKLQSELDNSNTDHATVVAYERCDASLPFEGNAYAVVALERESGRSTIEWVGEEIAEELQLW